MDVKISEKNTLQNFNFLTTAIRLSITLGFVQELIFQQTDIERESQKETISSFLLFYNHEYEVISFCEIF